ncbi:hypothetical protein MRB53_039406 [Persea americana]|nr:hypothetical protein MRB53_039406 [Persea americana]
MSTTSPPPASPSSSDLPLPLPLLIPLLALFLWLITTTTTSSLPSFSNKRILLLTAHPDDESMFFAPLLTRLTRPSAGNRVKILCLSTGDANGLGDVRKGEVKRAAEMLGVENGERDVLVLDDQRFRDGMGEVWGREGVVDALGRTIVRGWEDGDTKKIMAMEEGALASTEQVGSKTSSRSQEQEGRDDGPSRRRQPSTKAKTKVTAATISEGGVGKQANLDVLITFDKHGVSSHPNHIALFHGAVAFIEGLSSLSPPSSTSRTSLDTSQQATSSLKGDAANRLELYTLPSIPLYRKYISLLDVLPTLILAIIYRFRVRSRVSTAGKDKDKNLDKGNAKGKLKGKGKDESQGKADSRSARQREAEYPSSIVVISGPWEYARAAKAMVTGHWSQMVWFRWGWVGMGRYMVVGELRRWEGR